MRKSGSDVKFIECREGKEDESHDKSRAMADKA